MANGKRSNQVTTRQTVSGETDYEIKVRSRMEREKQKSELRMKEAAARHQRRLELIPLVALTLFILGAGGFCIYVLLSGRFQQEEKTWADRILKIIFGLASVFFYKQYKKKIPHDPYAHFCAPEDGYLHLQTQTSCSLTASPLYRPSPAVKVAGAWFFNAHSFRLKSCEAHLTAGAWLSTSLAHMAISDGTRF
jgi:hypothetical protein